MKLNPPTSEKPIFHIKINGSIIEHNFNSVMDEIQRKFNLLILENDEKLPINERINKISNWNINLLKLGQKFNSKYFNSSITFFNGIKEQLKDTILFENVNEPLNPVIESKEIKEDFKFTNNFDNVNEETLYKYFNENLVVKKYITKENLELFLKNAFENKLKNPTRIFNNPPTKEKFRKVFYNYYKDIAGKPHNKQTEYVELLEEYFIGFNTKTVKSNFNK